MSLLLASTSDDNCATVSSGQTVGHAKDLCDATGFSPHSAYQYAAHYNLHFTALLAY